MAEFQLTLPVWGATGGVPVGSPPTADFNSRSPCGERLVLEFFVGHHCQFQLTLPVWGATNIGSRSNTCTVISTHAPRVGSDICRNTISTRRTHFNSRSPCGERPGTGTFYQDHSNFNSRSPCGERRASGTLRPTAGDFNSRSPCGERPDVK